jgi:hypothetical protein
MEFVNNITFELENKIPILRCISFILFIYSLFLASEILNKKLFTLLYFPIILYCLLTTQNYILNLGLALFLTGYCLIHQSQQKNKSAFGIFLCFISAFIAPEVLLVLLTLKLLDNNDQKKYFKLYIFMFLAFVTQALIQYCADIYVQRVPVLIQYHDIHNSPFELLQNNFHRAIFVISQIALPIPSLFFKQTLTPTLSLILVFSFVQLTMLFLNRRLFIKVNQIILAYVIFKTILWSQDIYYDYFSIFVTNNYNSTYSGYILIFCLTTVFIHELTLHAKAIKTYLIIGLIFFAAGIQKEIGQPGLNQYNTNSPFSWVLLANRDKDSLQNICQNSKSLELTESENTLINWYNKILYLNCFHPEQLPILVDLIHGQKHSVDVPTIFLFSCSILKNNQQCINESSRLLELSSIYERSTAYYGNISYKSKTTTQPVIIPDLLTLIFLAREKAPENQISEQLKLLLVILDANEYKINNKEKFLILNDQHNISIKK